MSTSRTKNVVKNASYAMITQIVITVLNFVSRTIFIKMLGIEYVGINGLFSNILLLLSFAELGIGNAIIYSMYKPLAIKNQVKIKSLMKLYAKAYKIIGIVVMIVGLLVIPFMQFIIKEELNIDESIYFIYTLFLANSVVSYFFVYKKSIIIADQKQYIISIYDQVFRTLQIVLQIAVLLISANFILYLFVQIIFTIINNIAISAKANKLYPYLKKGTTIPLEQNEKKEIFSNIKALFLYKFGAVILNGTDNILISIFVGVKAVGLTSNYLLILFAIENIARQLMGAFTASVGNLNALEDEKSKEKVFKQIFLICAWLSGFLSIGILININPLIELWIGRDYILPIGVVVALIVHFYISNLHFVAYTYRSTMGLFVQGRYTPLIAAIINIILSIVLVKDFGLMGIFIATSISKFFTTGIVDPVLIYIKGFKKNPLSYFFTYFKFTLLFIGLYSAINFVVALNDFVGLIGFILNIVIVTVLFNGLMLLILWRNPEMILIKKRVLTLFKV